jgi:hypothetical protein
LIHFRFGRSIGGAVDQLAGFEKINSPFCPSRHAQPAVIEEESAMSEKTAFAVLAITTAMCVLGTTSVAWSFGYNFRQGGYVIPCSLEGVNPVYHPEIFGNPAVARAYGFVRGRNHTWQVIKNCHIY